MNRRVLLLEPYREVAEVITGLLDDLGYEVDIITSGDIERKELLAKKYACAFVNLDQNRSDWRDYGLRLAETASNAGIPVVMISRPRDRSKNDRGERLAEIK